jgi:hypothetical protein
MEQGSDQGDLQGVRRTVPGYLSKRSYLMTLKAYQINDCDIYAGETLEDAIQAAMDDTGNSRDEVFDGKEDCEADSALRVILMDREEIDDGPDEDNPSKYTTVGAIVAAMTKAGAVSSTEY